MPTGLKKILLTGSALVAVSLIGAPSVLAADGATPNTTSTILTPATGDDAPATADNAGPVAGDDGIEFGAGTISVTLGAAATGGTGSDGAIDADDSGGNAGGAGGSGVNMPLDGVSSSSHPALVINSGASATGGNGGDAGSVGAGGDADGVSGGAGGTGVRLDANFGTVTNNGTVLGGNGGQGGNASGVNRNGGTGGAGGSGITVLSTDNTVTVSGAVTGGIGGDGGNKTGTGTSGAGGAGGAGIALGAGATGASVNITSGATILGGAGGTGGDAGAGTAGVHGAAILIDTNGTTALLNNDGTIGGTSVAATGVDLTAGDTLTTLTNTGNVVTSTGIGLNIAGTLGTLNNSNGLISAGTGQAILVTGAGDIGTLTNTGGLITSANVTGNQGTFVLGADVGTLTFSGGVISNTADSATARVLNVTAAQSGVLTNAGAITAANATRTAILLSADITGSFVNDGTITGTIEDNANEDATLVNNGTITGAITLDGAGDTNFTQNTGGTVTGNIDLGDGTNTVDLNGGTITGTLTGGGGVDNLTLSGGTLAGATQLEGGANTVTVDGAFTTGGTFGATGGTIDLTVTGTGDFTVRHAMTQVRNVTIADSGVIALNEDMIASGNLTNNGALTLTGGDRLTVATMTPATGGTGATMTFEVRSETSFGELYVSAGAADLTDTDVDVLVDNSGYIGSGQLKIVDGNATVVGVDATGTQIADNSFLLDFTLARGDNAAIAGSSTDAYLIVDRHALDDIATTQNNRNVGAVLEDLGNTGPNDMDAFQGRLGTATTQRQIDDLLDSVTPDVGGGAYTAALNVGNATANLVSTRLSALRNGDSPTGIATGDTYGEESDGIRTWVQGFGSMATQDMRDQIAGYDANTYGVAVGVDNETIAEDMVLGIMGSYAVSDIDSDDVDGTQTDVDHYQVAFYGDYYFSDRTFLTGQAGFIYGQNETARHNVAGVPGMTAYGEFDTNQYVVRGELARYYYPTSGLRLTPSLLFNYNYVSFDSYTERGAGNLGLEQAATDDMQIFELGANLKAEWLMQCDNGTAFRPNLHGGYRYDLIGDSISTSAELAGGGGAFITEGFEPAQGTLTAGAGLSYVSGESWEFIANYDFDYREDYDAHTGLMRAVYKY